MKALRTELSTDSVEKLRSSSISALYQVTPFKGECYDHPERTEQALAY